MKKIVITTTSFGEFDKTPLKMCEDAGLEVVLNPYGRKISSEEFVFLANDAVGVIAGTEKIDRKVLASLSRLKVISRCGAGIDNVDQSAAKEFGIKVVNTPDAPTLAVAELTVGLILNLLRKIAVMDREIRQGMWKKQMGNFLQNKQVGIIGLGRIGTKVAELLTSFGCKIAYSDNYVESKIYKKMELMELLKWADIVSLHVSSKEEVLGKKELNSMKQGAWIVNTSRGGVVNETALFVLLNEGKFSGAALDVFEKEPYEGPLKDLDNVILTPHIGSYAKEARINMEIQAAENLLRLLK